MYSVLNKLAFSPGHKGKITYQTVRHYQVRPFWTSLRKRVDHRFAHLLPIGNRPSSFNLSLTDPRFLTEPIAVEKDFVQIAASG